MNNNNILSILVMSNGTQIIDIIGTSSSVQMFEGAIKIKVSNEIEMHKQMNIVYSILRKNGFEKVNQRMFEYA